MKYTIGICDDARSVCADVEAQILQFFAYAKQEVDVYVWSNAESFQRDCPTKVQLDILFLDIELPGANGISVGQYIRNTMQDDSMQIIYISSKTNYAMELFQNHPYDFLVKPIKDGDISAVLSKLVQLDAWNQRFFTYTYKRNTKNIPMGEIVYFESEKRYVHIHDTQGQTYTYIGKLSTFADTLPNNFVAIAKSFIVNIQQVRECSTGTVTMKDDTVLHISRAYRKAFDEALIKYGQ